jgi:hypothetical protein
MGHRSDASVAFYVAAWAAFEVLIARLMAQYFDFADFDEVRA